MPLPKDLSGDRWTQRIARHMLPWLIWAAKHHTAVTYGQIDAEVVHRKIHHHVHCAQYGHPAGTIGNGLIEIGEHLGYVIPPLNALMCGKTSRVPGHGCDWYLAEFLGREID